MSAAPVPSPADDAAAVGLQTRRCWRCLQQFPLDPTDGPGRPTEWWVCDPCHDSLLGERSR